MIPWWLQFYRRLVRVFLVRPWAIYGALFVPVLVTGFIVCVGWLDGLLETEARIRLSGAVLQVLGLLVVAIGIHKIRKDLKRPGTRELIWQWLSEVRGIFSKPKTAHKNSKEAIQKVEHVLAVLKSTEKPRRIDERVADLEKMVQGLSEEQVRLDKGMKEEASTREKADAKERRERISADESLRKLVETIEVGGIHLELMGLAWLFFGVVLGTFGREFVAPVCWVCALIGF